MLKKVVSNLFDLFSIILDISITPILLKLNFRHHTSKNSTFWKAGNLPFCQNILFAGWKFEISEYPIKPPYVTYWLYKYELHRIKTHEIRAKYFWTFFNSVHCSHFCLFSRICEILRKFKKGILVYVQELWVLTFHDITVLKNPTVCEESQNSCFPDWLFWPIYEFRKRWILRFSAHRWNFWIP